MTSVGIMASSVATGGTFLADPCENFTLAPWTTAGTVTIVAAKNANGFQFASNLSNTATYDIPAASQTSQITFGAWMKWSTGFFSTSGTHVSFRSDSGATVHGSLRVTNGGTGNANLYLYSGTSSILGQTTTKPIVLNTWYFIEVYFLLADSPLGAWALRLDGVTVASNNVADTKNAGTKTVYDRVVLSGFTSTTLQIDDIYLRNDGLFGP
jgi:hypothetical protein